MRKNKCKDIEIYPYVYVYNGKKTILMWQTSECGDSFRLNSNNNLIEAQSEAKIKKLLRSESKKVHWSESTEMDFDRFWKTLKTLKVGRASSGKTCKILLEGWNFIEDLARTIKRTEELRRLHSPLLNKIYKKLFYGNNLPSITPKGKSYSPFWLKEEISSFKNEFISIWKMFIRFGYIKP